MPDRFLKAKLSGYRHKSFTRLKTGSDNCYLFAYLELVMGFIHKTSPVPTPFQCLTQPNFSRFIIGLVFGYKAASRRENTNIPGNAEIVITSSSFCLGNNRSWISKTTLAK